MPNDPVRITDVAPRDGLQNERAIVPTADKVRLIDLLRRANVDEIEATSFVAPKWIPQLADAEDVLAGVRDLFSANRQSCIAPPLPLGEGRGEGLRDAYPKAPKQSGSTKRARALRRGMTMPERILWKRLRADRLQGLRFRRQHPIGDYIVDFYCPGARLVVELDGESHRRGDSPARDAVRDAFLESQGLWVLRFGNQAVVKDADAVAKTILTRIQRGPTTSTGTPLPPPLPLGEGAGRIPSNTTLSVLVPNAKGFDRALAIHRAGFPLKIAVFTAASETFAHKNTNATIDETIDRFAEFLPIAFDEGMPVRFYISCAVACPFEGPIAPDTVRAVADRLLALAPRHALDKGDIEIDLGDTIGAARPADIAALLARFTPAEIEQLLVLHLHDTFGRAADCAQAALELGVRSFDASAGGLGGCPYAGTPEKPAPGNIATATVLDTIERMGMTTNVDRAALDMASAFARDIISRARRDGAMP
jgi:hydroxymethylglutaryl-CoA lyase